jgi:hypothetical protein
LVEESPKAVAARAVALIFGERLVVWSLTSTALMVKTGLERRVLVAMGFIL